MKRSILLIPICLLIFSFCEKQEVYPEQKPKREMSTPEAIESELMEILGRNWKELSDTLHYFDSTMLSKGKLKGTAPDGIYYELKIKVQSLSSIKTTFKVKDSIWIEATGQILPIKLDVKACNTDLQIRAKSVDTTAVSIDNMMVHIPHGFILRDNKQAPLLYKGKKVGYLTKVEMENLDYTSGTYLVIHYDNDPRTFSFYDKGLSSVIEFFDIELPKFPQFSTKSGLTNPIPTE